MMCRSILRWFIVSDISEVTRELEVGAHRHLKRTTITLGDIFRENSRKVITPTRYLP